MRLNAHVGYFKDNLFREVARIDLGKRKHAGYVYDWYLHPVGTAVQLYDPTGVVLVEDRIGNNLRALQSGMVLGAMQDDNDEAEEPRWTWEMAVLDAPKVTHVVLGVW